MDRMRSTDRHRPLRMLLPLLLLPVLAPARPASGEPRRPIQYVDGVPDTGQFLPNSTLLGRVGDRRITVLDFRDAYYAVDPRYRPSSDSTGRAELLKNMVRKEVLGLTALKAGYSLDFVDRAKLRETRARLLSNRLFEAAVLNVSPPSEDSLRTLFEYQKREQKMRVLHFPDRASAEKARRELVRGGASWATYAARFTPSGLAGSAGELNWSQFEKVPLQLALVLWKLKPGQLSPVLEAPDGFQVFQVTEVRERRLPEFSFMRASLEDLVRSYQSDVRRREITDAAKVGMDVRYDTTNVRYASALFPAAVRSDGRDIVIDENVPEIAPKDTARTIVQWNDGRISLGVLSHAYTDLPPVMRPAINTPERLMNYADALMLEPRMPQIAVERGLEQDSLFRKSYDEKYEQLLVEKMVEDSCFRGVSVTPKERREYYDKHQSGFITFPTVRYAVIVRDTKAAADSVKARLDAGAKVEQILRADSLAGNARSGIQEASTNDHIPLEKLLFEELREGQCAVMGPDSQKAWACFYLMKYDPGHLLPYESVEGVVDESVRNEKSEAALNAFAARRMKQYDVVAHFELLPRILLTVPTAEEKR